MTRSLKIITCEAILKELDVLSLNQKRLRGDIVAVFKYIKDFSRHEDPKLFFRCTGGQTKYLQGLRPAH